MNCKFLPVFFLLLFSFTNSYAQKFLFPYPHTENNFISFCDTNFHSAYLKIIGKESNEFYFFISAEKHRGVFASNENFVDVPSENFTLFNFSFSFLTLKYNVIPYIHPDFVIKFLFLLNKVKNYPRISDAMRTVESQLKYKKRGWSNVEDSPHLLGLAADLSYYTRSDREIIQRYNKDLGVRFLEHGGRGNHHIHMQDDIIWLLKKDKNISRLSDSLNKKIIPNFNILKPYAEKLYSEDFRDGIEFNFSTDKTDLIKIEFENTFGQKLAIVVAGVFENGNHKIFIRTDFLKKGIYCARVFKGGMYEFQKSVLIK